MVVNVVHALLLNGSWQAIRGIGVWLKRKIGVTPPWIMAAEEQGKSRYLSVQPSCDTHVTCTCALLATRQHARSI